MQFIDEKNDLPFGLGDLLDHGFEAILKLPAILGPGDQSRQVQRHDALRFENIRNVAGHDTLCQAFDHRGLAHTGFADQHGVVFRAPRQNLHHAPDFVVAPDHRIELAASRQLRQIAGVLLKRSIGGFRSC